MNGKHPVETKTLFIALLVGWAHIASGVAVLIEPAALQVTPLALFHHFLIMTNSPAILAASLLIGAGIMAVLGSSSGLVTAKTWSRACLFLPQQLLLLFQLATISWALMVGHYPDGYVPRGGGWFILADQVWAWILAASHSLWLAAFLYGGIWGVRSGDT